MHKNSNNDTFNWYKIVFKNPLLIGIELCVLRAMKQNV